MSGENSESQEAKETKFESRTFMTQAFLIGRPEVVPAYTALAMEYAVFDRWFASVPASTQPNRFYVHSATSFGAMSNVRNDLIAGFPQKTIFDSITDSGHSFGIYYQNIPATLFYHNLRKLKYVTKFHDYSLKFKQHAKRGVLPNYVVVEQRYFDMNLLPANDDHPSHDVAQGQAFVKEVYEILRASPQWKEMLFVITYDEHGGFYDHVPTPADDVPNPDGLVGDAPYYFDFKRLGVRVPTIMISPWINKGTGMLFLILFHLPRESCFLALSFVSNIMLFFSSFGKQYTDLILSLGLGSCACTTGANSKFTV
jgi:phospholipase C